MRFKRLFSILLIKVFFLAYAINGLAADGSTGYWGSVPGKVWKTGFGTCWKNMSWAPEKVVNCNGVATPVEQPVLAGNFLKDDEDDDGIVNSRDRCPFTSAGVAVDGNGCAHDDDHDGVPNYLDQCLETSPGNVVDVNGCTLALLELEGVHFWFDSSKLTAEAKAILDRGIYAIQSHPSKNIDIEGHTDSSGPDAYNRDLSQRRAQSVVDYLTSKGVDRSRLNAKGYGESSPVASNNSKEGRAANRRVEIYAR